MKEEKYELVSLIKMKEEYEQDVCVAIFYSSEKQKIAIKMYKHLFI